VEQAIAEIVKMLLNLGLPGIAILGAGYWINQQQKRINELTDKVIAMSAEQSAASEAMTGAVTRLTDTLVRGGKAE
jgi:hypothetical protein